MRLLRELLTLDDIGIAMQQNGDESRGVQIHGMDIASGQGSSNTTTAPSKGKGKEATDAAIAKKVTDDDVLMKGVPEETTGGSADLGTAPTLAVGTKRTAAPSNSSSLAKRSFWGPWRAQYVKHPLIWLLS
jgi:hypothetical protein